MQVRAANGELPGARCGGASSGKKTPAPLPCTADTPSSHNAQLKHTGARCEWRAAGALGRAALWRREEARSAGTGPRVHDGRGGARASHHKPAGAGRGGFMCVLCVASSICANGAGPRVYDGRGGARAADHKPTSSGAGRGESFMFARICAMQRRQGCCFLCVQPPKQATVTASTHRGIIHTYTQNQVLEKLDGEGCARVAGLLASLPHDSKLVVGQAYSCEFDLQLV